MLTGFFKNVLLKSSTAKTFSVYAFTLIFNAGISFSLFSLITHYLTAEDYGIINLYTSFCFLLSPFIAIGSQFALNVGFYRLGKDEYPQYFTNISIAPVLLSVAFTLLIILFYGTARSFMDVGLFFWLLLPFTCLLTTFSDVILYLIRNRQTPFLFARFSILKTLAEVACVIILVVFLHAGWKGRLGGAFISLLAVGLFSVYLIAKWKLWTGKFQWKAVMNGVREGLPFIPERLAIFALGYSDRFFIEFFNGTTDVGIFSVGAQIAVILNMVMMLLNNTFHPVIFSSLSQAERDYKKIRKVILIYVGVNIFMCTSLIIAVPIIFKYFIGKNFALGEVYATNLIIAMFFWSFYNLLQPFLLYLKKNWLFMYLSVAGIVASVILNYLCIKNFGPIGATYSRIGVYVIMCLLMVGCVHKYYNLRTIFPRRTAA